MKLLKANRFLLISTLLFIMLNLVLFPEIYIKSVTDGLKIWALSVLPALFPFFFLTALLTKTGAVEKFAKLSAPATKKLFRCSGISGYVYLMSVISGYPVGAKLICDLRGQNLISKGEADRMSTFCSTSGPLFIFGSVAAGMFLNKKAGVLIFAAHIAASLLSGIIFRNYGEKTNAGGSGLPAHSSNTDNVLYDCIYSSVVSILIVGGFIAVFFVAADMLINLKILSPLAWLFSAMLKPFGITPETASGLVQGLIESTRGCFAVASCGTNPLTVALASMIISFGGMSINIQAICYLQKCGVKVRVYLLSKLLQSVISFLICFALGTLFL